MRKSLYRIVSYLLILSMCFSLFGTNVAFADESRPTVPFDRSWVPEPVYDANPGLLDMYWYAWEKAWDHVLTDPGAPASPFMDEAFNPGQIWIWDTCFMSMFCKYAPDRFPGVESLNNFYKPMFDNTPSTQNIYHRNNPPLFAWVEWQNYKLTGDKSRLTWLMSNKYLQKDFKFMSGVDTAAQWVSPEYG